MRRPKRYSQKGGEAEPGTFPYRRDRQRQPPRPKKVHFEGGGGGVDFAGIISIFIFRRENTDRLGVRSRNICAAPFPGNLARTPNNFRERSIPPPLSLTDCHCGTAVPTSPRASTPSRLTSCECVGHISLRALHGCPFSTLSQSPCISPHVIM